MIHGTYFCTKFLHFFFENKGSPFPILSKKWRTHSGIRLLFYLWKNLFFLRTTKKTFKTFKIQCTIEIQIQLSILKNICCRKLLHFCCPYSYTRKHLSMLHIISCVCVLYKLYPLNYLNYGICRAVFQLMLPFSICVQTKLDIAPKTTLNINEKRDINQA